jgi:hypothetical protein
MNRPINRIAPRLDAGDFQTFQIAAPVASHWRNASCGEVACPQAERGWRMQLDLSTELGRKQAYYIKYDSGRSFTHRKVDDSGMVELTFPSGQECFQQHRVRLDREEKYIVRGGDFRGNPRGVPARVHTKPEHWVEEFQENSDAMNSLKERG